MEAFERFDWSEVELRKALNVAFRRRHDRSGQIGVEIGKMVLAKGGHSELASGAAALASVLREIVRVALKNCQSDGKFDAEELVAGCFRCKGVEDLNKGSACGNVRRLSLVVSDSVQGWREAALKQSIGIPSLVDYSWRLENTVSTDSTQSLSSPSIALHMKYCSKPTITRNMPDLETLSVHMNKETLHSFLGNLETIKTRLETMSIRNGVTPAKE